MNTPPNTALRILGSQSSVRILSVVCILGFVTACCYHFFLGLMGFNFPWDTFLFESEDRFNDWYNAVASAETHDPYFRKLRAVAPYFPFAYITLQVGAGISKFASLIVFLVTSLGLFLSALLCIRNYDIAAGGQTLVRKTDLSLYFLAFLISYPVIYTLDRGNLDLIIASFCIFYVATLHTRHAFFGTVAISIAIAMKGYPAAFLLLGIYERRYFQVGICGAISVTLTLLALATFTGGIIHNFSGFLEGLKAYQQVYVLGPHSLFASSDPYNGIRSLFLILKGGRPVLESGSLDLSQFSSNILPIYSVFITVFALLSTIFVLVSDATRWQRVMAICLVALVFPNVANDYKLCILFPGILSLILERDVGVRSRAALALSCLLMIPKSYFFIGGLGITNLINPILLVLLSVVVLADLNAWRDGLKFILRPRKFER